MILLVNSFVDSVYIISWPKKKLITHGILSAQQLLYYVRPGPTGGLCQRVKNLCPAAHRSLSRRCRVWLRNKTTKRLFEGVESEFAVRVQNETWWSGLRLRQRLKSIRKDTAPVFGRTMLVVLVARGPRIEEIESSCSMWKHRISSDEGDNKRLGVASSRPFRHHLPTSAAAINTIMSSHWRRKKMMVSLSFFLALSLFFFIPSK